LKNFGKEETEIVHIGKTCLERGKKKAPQDKLIKGGVACGNGQGYAGMKTNPINFQGCGQGPPALAISCDERSTDCKGKKNQFRLCRKGLNRCRVFYGAKEKPSLGGNGIGLAGDECCFPW